jgi:hypothetical protein
VKNCVALLGTYTNKKGDMHKFKELENVTKKDIDMVDRTICFEVLRQGSLIQ